jgi:hypothetical protein
MHEKRESVGDAPFTPDEAGRAVADTDGSKGKVEQPRFIFVRFRDFRGCLKLPLINVEFSSTLPLNSTP